MNKSHYFIRNPDSSEPWAYCGDFEDLPALIKAIGNFIIAEIENDFGGSDTDRFTVEVKRMAMTDAEVEAIPEM